MPLGRALASAPTDGPSLYPTLGAAFHLEGGGVAVDQHQDGVGRRSRPRPGITAAERPHADDQARGRRLTFINKQAEPIAKTSGFSKWSGGDLAATLFSAAERTARGGGRRRRWRRPRAGLRHAGGPGEGGGSARPARRCGAALRRDRGGRRRDRGAGGCARHPRRSRGGGSSARGCGCRGGGSARAHGADARGGAGAPRRRREADRIVDAIADADAARSARAVLVYAARNAGRPDRAAARARASSTPARAVRRRRDRGLAGGGGDPEAAKDVAPIAERIAGTLRDRDEALVKAARLWIAAGRPDDALRIARPIAKRVTRDNDGTWVVDLARALVDAGTPPQERAIRSPHRVVWSASARRRTPRAPPSSWRAGAAVTTRGT